MYRAMALGLALLALAACQNDPPPHVAGPPAGDSLMYKPLPPLSPPPAYSAGQYRYGNYAYGSSQYWQYRYGQSSTSTQRDSTRTQPAPSPNQSRPLPALPKVPAAPPMPPVAGAHDWAIHVAPRAWKYIVIHHSDTRNGSATTFARYHKEVRHWQELGHHFVIDNGDGGPDGRVEVGARWTRQMEGAHAGVLLYNDQGIGICLVGNFNVSHPTGAQMHSLAHLVVYLMHTYHIPAEHVIGHRDAKHTDCPGRNMNLATVRQMAMMYAGLGGAGPVLASR